MTGNLTMRGVTKQITFPVQFLGFIRDPWGNDKAGFSLATTLNRKDYGVNWNKALDNGGVLVSDHSGKLVDLPGAQRWLVGGGTVRVGYAEGVDDSRVVIEVAVPADLADATIAQLRAAGHDVLRVREDST